MFAHHGYDAETFVGDNPNDDSTNETDNSNNEDGANSVEERANNVEDGHNYAEDVAYDIEGVGISNGCGGGDAVRIEDGDDANVEDQCESVDLQRFSVGHMEAVSQDPSDDVHHFNINCNNYVEPRTSTPVSNFTARRILGSIQNTPERDNAVHISPAKTGNTCMLQDTPKLPRYISEKKNWGRRENDPAVKDFLANHESPRKKRKLKPRNVFTPSSYD